MGLYNLQFFLNNINNHTAEIYYIECNISSDLAVLFLSKSSKTPCQLHLRIPVMHVQITLTSHPLLFVSPAVGVYVKSSEPLNVVANMVNNNRGAGMSIIQSAQLTRLVGNCVLCNGWTGVAVDRESRVELRGNGVYGNGCHGVCFRGDGLIVENDVVGNNSVGIRVMDNADVKVSVLQSLCHMVEKVFTGNILK